jgi:hypothetical protein
MAAAAAASGSGADGVGGVHGGGGVAGAEVPIAEGERNLTGTILKIV